DAGPLPVADEPAQKLRFVYPDDEPVGRVEDRRIVDELAGRALAAVELLANRVQVLRETAQVAGELLAELFVTQQDWNRAASLLEILRDDGQRDGRLRKIVDELVDLLFSLRVSQQRGNRS